MKKSPQEQGRASRQKGKRFEREVANLFKAHGFEAKRTAQFCGKTGTADVDGVDGLHIECKAVERLNLNKAMEQSMSDAREGEVPIVIHKMSRKPILVTMKWEDWIELYKGSHENSKQENDSENGQGDSICRQYD